VIVNCPQCGVENAGAAVESACRECGKPLGEAVLAQKIEDIRRLTDRMKGLAAPRKSFYTFNGFGTTLLDYRPAGDGTFEATRWVVALFFPVFPLATYRIRPTEEKRSYGRETYGFEVLERGDLSAGRVVRPYLLALLALAVPAVVFYYGKSIERAIGGLPTVIIGLLSIVWCFYILFTRIKNEGKAYKQRSA